MARAQFIRTTADERRAALIAATRAVLARSGAGGLSVRAICAEAGVSPGLLVHYFAGIDALVAAAYAQVGEEVAGVTEAVVAAAGTDPRARLEASVIAAFRPPVSDPALLATWLGFWSLVKSDPAIAALHRDIYAADRARVERLAIECGVARDDARLFAIGMTALVDGLWLERSLDPSSFTAEEAEAIARRWLGALIG